MRCLAAALVSLLTRISSTPSSRADVIPLVLGTATPGGGFAVYAQAVADTLLETDPALKLAAAPRPDVLHSGVARYFREIGLMR